MMEEVAFMDVKEVRLEWPLGTWAKSAYHKRIGARFQRDLSMAVEGIALGLFVRGLGMKREEADQLVNDLRKDVEDRRLHEYQAL